MQNDETKLNMPGAFKDNRGNGNINSTSSDSSSSVPASIMRASNTNPYGQNYQVAGPTIGGTATPYDSNNIEQAKDHLNNSLTGDDHNNPPNAVNTSITDTVIQGASTAASTAASAASTAATGAAAAGVSVIAAARKLISYNDDGDEITENHATISPQKSDNGLEFLHQKKLNPGDRPPAKVSIQAKKPSGLATYGNLDSPGAHGMSGPLPDRVRVGTPPVVESNIGRTIADPFGPVKVTNWSESKREVDASTPTSEDFESHFDHDSHPVHGPTVTNKVDYFHSSARRVSHSPLKNETDLASTDDTIHNLPNTFASGQSAVINEVPLKAPTAVKPAVNHSPALAAAGAVGAASIGAIAAAQHTDSHMAAVSQLDSNYTNPVSNPVSSPVTYTTTTTTTVPVAPNIPMKTERIPIAQPPVDVKKNVPVAEPHAEVKRVPIAQPPTNLQHPIQTTTSQHVPVAPATHSTHTTAVPIVAAATTPGATAEPAKLKDSGMDMAGNALHRDSPSDIPKDNSASLAATDASILKTEQDYAKHDTAVPVMAASTHSANANDPTTSRPLSETMTTPLDRATADVPGTAVGTPSYMSAMKDGVRDSMSGSNHKTQTTETSPVQHRYEPEVAPDANVATSAPKQESIHYNTSEHNTQNTVPDVGNVTTTSRTTTPPRPLTERATAPIIGATVGTAAYMNVKKDSAKEPMNEADSTSKQMASYPAETHRVLVKPIEHVEYTLRPEHPATASVPVRTTAASTASVPIAERANLFSSPTAGTAAHLGARTDEVIESKTHPYPPAGTTTHTIPAVNTTTSHTTIPATLKTATTSLTAPRGMHHSLSEYGPADLKDLKLDDPSKIRASGVPIVTAAAATTAAATLKTATTSFAAPRAMHHSLSEYGPADPKDLKLDDPSKIRALGIPIVTAAAATTAAATGVKEGLKQSGSAPKTASTTKTHTNDAPVTTHVETIKPAVAVPAPASHTVSTTAQRSNPVLAAPGPISPMANATNSKTTTTPTHNNNIAPVAAVAAATIPAVSSTHRNTTTANVNGTDTTTTNMPNTMNNNKDNNMSSSLTTTGDHKLPAAKVESDRIAAAMPDTYKGPLPVAHPGEEVIWVKTITTTNYYDDEATGVMDRNGDVISTQQNVLTPNDYANAHDTTTTLTPNKNTNGNNNGRVEENGRRRSNGFLNRLLGRRHSSNNGKGKQRV
ncbi:hypothetical protein BG004_006135 [Podila humilis]|nr:hypothetical protein BG004_006135 [Podila humilis]